MTQSLDHTQDERAAIVAWLRAQARDWEARSRRNAKKLGIVHRATEATAGIAASYDDHADAIERGEHLQTQEPRT